MLEKVVLTEAEQRDLDMSIFACDCGQCFVVAETPSSSSFLDVTKRSSRRCACDCSDENHQKIRVCKLGELMDELERGEL